MSRVGALRLRGAVGLPRVIDMEVMGLQASVFLEVEGPSENPHVDQQHMVS